MAELSGMSPTFYAILGVAENASAKEISRAWRTRAAEVHPDKGGSAEAFLALREAYDTLGSPVSRAVYDGRLNSWRRRAAEAHSARIVTTLAVPVDQPSPTEPRVTPKASAVGSFSRAVADHGLLAVVLTLLGWASVYLRSRGYMTIFEPRTSSGALAKGLPSTPPLFSVSLFEGWFLALVVASLGLGRLWYALGWRAKVALLTGIEVFLLSVAGLAAGLTSALAVDALVAAMVAGLYASVRWPGVARFFARVAGWFTR